MIQKQLTLVLFLLLSFPVAQASAQQSSISFPSNQEIQTVTTPHGFYLLKTGLSSTRKCAARAQIARFYNYTWSQWRPALCLTNGKRSQIGISGTPYLTFDPNSRRLYLLVNYTVRNNNGQSYQIVRTYYTSPTLKRWKGLTLERISFRKRSLYQAGEIAAAVHKNRLWVVFQQASSSYQRINSPFYFYSYALNGRKKSANLTKRRGSRLEIDGRYSALSYSEDPSFYLLPQGSRINLLWTLQRANGQELSFRAVINQLNKPRLIFSGQYLEKMPGEINEENADGRREISPGDDGKIYMYETINYFDYQSESTDTVARYSIYRFLPESGKFIPWVQQSASLGENFALLNSLLVLGYGVDGQGQGYIAQAGYDQQDCILSVSPSYQCWDWAVPNISNQVVTVNKFSPSGAVVASSQMALPRYGSFRPESRLLQWVNSDLAVRRITASTGGLRMITALGQEGTSDQGAITPRVEDRLYQRSLDLAPLPAG